MKNHVIIGNGGAAINGIIAIREHGCDPILVISKENCLAYSPLLIPHYISGEIPYEAMFLCDYAFYKRNQVETRFGSAAVQLDTNTKSVYLEDGSRVFYDCLLIATGSRPMVPSIPGVGLPSVHTVWTEKDARQIKKDCNKAFLVTIVGGGAIGMYMMDVLCNMRKQVTIIEAEPKVMSAVLDSGASNLLEKRMKDHGIQLHLKTKLLNIEQTSRKKILTLDNGTMLEADMVIITTGVVPNATLARNSVNVSRGIVVDEYCRTNVPDIYAAGDVTETMNPLTQKNNLTLHGSMRCSKEEPQALIWLG